MNKTIVMTVCQRPFYLEPILNGWSQVRGYKDWRFLFVVENTPTRDVMLKLIDDFDHPNKLVMLNETKLGVLENPYQGLKRAFEDSDFAILAEEDLLPSTNILEYFDWANETFADLTWVTIGDIIAVCANGSDVVPKDSEQGLVEVLPHFAVWLWGTWKQQWVDIIEPTWDHDYSSGVKGDGKSGFDWNLNLRVVPENGFCVFPGQPLVDHLGKYLGVHLVGKDTYDATRPKGFVQHRDNRNFYW